MGDNEYNITDYDMDHDGKITEEDKEIAKLKYEEERLNRRQYHQRQMAWTALWAMILFTIFLFMPIIPDARIKLLSEISSMFYIAQAGIVGAFLGVTAWMNVKK